MPFKQALAEAGANIRLLWPLALTQIATAAIGITDILMMGWLGPAPLAAGTLAVHLFTITTVMIGGLLTSASPLMALRYGAGETVEAKRIVWQSLKIGAVLSVLMTAITWHTESLLPLLGQKTDLAALGAIYAKANALSFAPALFLLLLRNYAAACGRPNLGLAVLLFGITANAFGNYVLMFGRFGFPKLGLLGTGIATTAAFIMMLLIILLLIQRDRGLRLGRAEIPGTQYVRSLLRLGYPICLTGLAQVGTFLVATMAIGRFGAEQIAGHAIALQSANVGFALLWGGAQATTVRISWAVGAGNQSATERAAWVGMLVGIAVSFVLAATVLLLRHHIVDLFLAVDQPENLPTVTIALHNMIVVALYQLVNGSQLVASAALRGLHDTRVPMQIIIFVYWFIGGVLAYWMGFVLDMRSPGIWFGLTLAIILSSSILVLRLKRLLPGVVMRIAST